LRGRRTTILTRRTNTAAPLRLAAGLAPRVLPFAAALVAALPAGCKKREGPPPGGAARRPEIITTKTGIEMVAIPAGEFVMGSDRGERDEKPPRRVRIAALYMDRTEVTQKAYEALTGTKPAKFKDPNRPVERLSWLAAAKYCNLRSLREGLTPCYGPQFKTCNFDADGYRLPTEAEWEYACRAGTATRYSFGDDARARLVQDQRGEGHAPRGRQEAERLGPLRHARQRGRVVQRLLR
jgi:formylglycine-generating enzyme required for sulfatase activity